MPPSRPSTGYHELEREVFALNERSERDPYEQRQRVAMDDDPKAIERLGKYYAILGPRFKTMDKQAMKKRADCRPSHFQRWLKHQREIGALPMDPLEDLPTFHGDSAELRPDTSSARREWLTHRSGPMQLKPRSSQTFWPRKPEAALELLDSALEEFAFQCNDL